MSQPELSAAFGYRRGAEVGLIHAVVNDAAACCREAVAVRPSVLLQAASKYEMSRPAQQWRIDDHEALVATGPEFGGIDQGGENRGLLAKLPGSRVRIKEGVQIHACHTRYPLLDEVALESEQCRQRKLARPLQIERGQSRVEARAQRMGRAEVSQVDIVTLSS